MSKKNWLRILMVFVCLMLVCTCVPAEDCAHPEDRQQVMYSDWEDATFVNNNDGRTHTATYINPFEMIKCMDCGLEYRNDLTMDPVVEPHGFARGVCDCGALEEDTNCVHTASDYDHANSTYSHEGALDSKEYVSLGAEEHQVSYTPLDVYVCPTCGCTYDRVGEFKTVTEAHRFMNGECRYCHEPAAAAEYTLTYTFENHPFGTNSYTAEFEAGSVVTLDVSVGEVAENHHTGDMARLKSWTEDVPSNAQPVEFSTSENQQGNTAYSFTMPARNVTVHGVWETVYSIVYVDNAWYCDDKFEDEWHFAAYGEPTPLYNGGVDPYHEGYWFAGWQPEIAETVTGNARYIARFGLDGEDCAHINFHCTSEYETRLPEGAEWTPDNAGFHTVYGWSGAVYVCDTCGKELLDGGYGDLKRMCYDGDGDGHCDTCRWYICDHPGMGVTDDHHYELKAGENWTWVRTGHHGANCNVGNWYWCELCRQGIFEPTGEEYITEGCWDNNDDDRCDGCGGQMCHHENRDVHSPDWYQPVEGESWQHVGWGHHGANCNVGIGFYCFDCEENYAETHSQEYRVEQCWEGDNKDNRCDGCGCEFGGNWGTCNHEGEQEYFNHYSVNDDGWVDNGNGTHTGMAIEVWGFNCRNCNNFFGRPNHDDYRLYTVPHGYNPENGKCWDCGAEMTACEHDPHIRTGETLVKDTRYMDNDDGTHMRFDRLLDLCICQVEGCGAQFYLDGDEIMTTEGHTFSEDGWCVCGAKNCDHSDLSKLRLEEEEMIRLLWGTGWRHTGWNTHTGTGTKYDRYYCEACEHTVLVPVNGTGETEVFEIACFSRDDDKWCDDCGWDFSCDHTRETLEVKDPEHYEPVEGESWEYIGNNRHTALCYKGVWYRCNKCEQEFFGDVSEEPVEAICGCWDDDRDGHCDGCGARIEECPHEHTSDWHTSYDVSSDWTDNGFGQHSAKGWELWGFDCYDCERFIGERTHEDERIYTFDHGYDENGVCGACGAVYPGCDHENATFNEKGKQFNQVVEDMFDGRHVRWFDVYHEYTCNDCGAVFLRYVERGEEIEEHVSHNGENCDICGAPVCDHTDLTRLELVRENVVILNPGREWRRSTTGSHTGYGVMGDIYYCGDCNHRVYARNEGEEPRYLTEDCFDGDDEDNRCDACDWPFCEHPEDQLEHKEDGFHHCVQDEGWYYVGDGKHSAVCEVGTYYYCHACDHEVFVKEVDAKLYTYDCHDGNGDESCDACGAYVAPCPHYNRTDDYYHYGGMFVDNGNGTHTGMGYEMYGFWCRDCEEYIADVTHEEAREYTFEHNFNEDGVCDADGCGAVYSGCDHENATFNKRGKQFNQVVEDMFDGRHVRWFDVYHEFTCDDCGAVFLRYIERGEEIEEHVSHNGENCDICGAPVCDHTDLTRLELVRENVVIREPGSEWHRSTTGSHTGYGVMGDIYYCGACNHRVYARNEGEEPRYLTEDCFDGDDEDNRCDACDWPFCEHKDKEHLEDNFHSCVEDEGWYYVGNYQHSAVCEVGTWYFCHDCDEHVFEKQSDAKLYTYGCWDDNADGRCDTCGADACRHENIDVRNGYHYQPAPGHEWEENWYGQHGAECDVGIWFYCHDCGQEGFRRDYREYVVEQCWEGDNKDNRCDGCGHEYGENWGNCNHDGNVSPMYNHYELKDGTEWVVNDNGTHSGWAIEVWGFQCWDCGTHIAQPKHDDYRWYTVPHSFNEENKTCHDCGASVPDCHHEHGEPTGNTEFLYVEYINNDDGTHMVVARLLDEFKCQDCGETFLRDDGHETVYAEDHTYENGKCIHCAYPQCDHSDLSKLRLEESGMVRPVWGDEWESNGTGKHTCMGVKYDRYTCTECGWAWLVPVDGTEAKYYEDDCYDDNDDDHCDECGFFFCDHEHRHVENDEHYEPVPGAKWKPSGNGRHTATCNVGYWYECDDCGQGWFVGASEETVEFEGWCWDDENRPDGHCDDCGQEMCRHEGNTSPWRNEYHCDWEYYNENLHHGWGYEVHGFECYDCDQFIGERTHKEEREFFSEHHYNEKEGKCWDCGMEMTCGHWGSANYIEGSDQWHNLVFENLFDGTHACYYDLFRGYTCVECGQTFMRNEGRHSEIQDHSIVDGECEACGAKVCTHTYTDENKIGEHILRPMPGYSFHGEGMGYHWTEYGVWYDVYLCADCGEQVFVALGEVEQNVRKDCFDVDDNDECDVCSWPVNCTHPDREPREECHWWIENAMPEHIGGGMHEVLAHFGMMYYCPDCDRDFFDAYEGYKLYAFHCEDRNGDGLCDDCRVEMECEHNGDGKEWYQHMVTGPWTDNGNGTHSAEGYWVWGFDCDCGEFIGHPDQANKITFTCDHYYEDGVCHCGVKKTCDHKNITPIDGGDFFNEVYENLYNGTHNYAYDVYEWTHCNDCDTDFLRFIVREEEHDVPHEFEDGVCGCGAQECDHAETTPVELNEFLGSDWKRDYRGHHEAWGAFYDRLNCNACRETVLVQKSDEGIHTFDCFDDDEDGECDECGYDFCEHPNLKLINDEHYEPIPGSEWEYNGNGTHRADCRVAVLMWCPDCGHHTRDYISNEIVTITQHCWDEEDGGDGYCDDCGAEYVPCTHPNKVLDNPEHWEPVEGEKWVYDSNGYHKALCNIGPAYECPDCDEYVIGEPERFRVMCYQECWDDDGDGECDGCGKEYLCDHKNADRYEGVNEYVCDEWIDNGDGTHSGMGYEKNGYHCPDCGQFIAGNTHDNPVKFTMPHEFGADGLCVQCGAEQPTCEHENVTPTGAEPERVNPWIGDRYDGQHIIWYDELITCTCDICGETVKVLGEERKWVLEDHTFEDGECVCGAKDCVHEKKLQKEDEFITSAGSWKQPDGYGKHGVYGAWYDIYVCEECGQFEYVLTRAEEYVVEDCFDEDDGHCDECGWKFPCEHPEDRVIQTGWSVEQESFADTGDGRTHEATYTNLFESYRCLACGATWEYTAETETRTESHAFVADVCACGAENTFCEHENAEKNHEAKKDETCTWLSETEHEHRYVQWDVYYCSDCGCSFDVEIDLIRKVEEHTFGEDGECLYCVKACPHENAAVEENLITDAHYAITPGTEYVANQTGCHIVHATKGKLYECPDCGENVFVPDGEGQDYFFECLDEDNDLVCDLCGWEFPDCDHANRGEEYSHFVGNFTDNGDGTHYGYGTELRGFWCPDCEEYLAKPTHEGLVYYENIPHSWEDDGKCSECGALKADCVHPQDKQTLLYWQGGEVASYDDHGDSYHTVVYVTATENYQCGVCGEKYQVLAEMKEDIQTHSYVDDKCACGAANDRCAHENREWRYEDRKNGKYVYLNEEFHSASYTALDMYQCLDCSCFFSIEGEHKTIAEEAHVLIGENECAYCGEFGDMYKLTFRYEGDLPSYVEGRDTRVKAGDTVTLPIPVGQVVENQETGFRTRLESWTETVPEGKNPVEFSYATDEWGNTEYSFTMPEREVTMTGTWEQVYSVVYCDGVEDEELFRDEWHAVNYGEPTPAFNGGEDPVREGYLFKGWDPEVAETVTEDVEYYAVWELCEHENFEYTENWEASGYRGWAEKIEGNDYKHTALYTKHHEAKCLDCGALFSHVYEEGAEEADHTYVNGKCTQCAYTCGHADQTNDICDACKTDLSCKHELGDEDLIEANHYRLAEGSQWTPDGKGYHVATAQLGNLYYCGECEKHVFVALEEMTEHRFECIEDENEDGLCDVCGGSMLKDETAPRFTLVGLEPATGIVGCEVKVIAQFTDETELGCYKLYINDVLADEGELSGLTGEMAFTTTELAVGEHYFKLEVYDAADNCCKYPWPNPVTITAANTAPVIEDIASTAGNTFKVGTEVTFSTNVTDDYGLSKIELYVDGKIEQTTAVGEKMFPVSFTTDALTVGEHTVRVVAEDKDGLTAEKSLTVTVVPCTHDFREPTGGHEEELVKREVLNDYQHKDYVNFYDEMYCPDCGETFDEKTPKEFMDDHAYVNGKCTECEHVCQHPAWNGNVCDACEHVCVHDSWNEDGTCAECGTACEHPTIRPDDETITDKVYGEAVIYTPEESPMGRDEVHKRKFTAMADFYCETCGIYVKTNEITGSESELHEFGDDYVCDLCGYEKLHITRQPENTWAYVGENAMFTVEAVGDELTYTWYYKNASASKYSESTIKEASIGVQMTEARDGRQMYCVVKDKYGNTVKTDTVTMTLRTKLEITKQPTDDWAYDGEKATTSVTATGDDLRYEWYYRNAGDSEFTKSTTTAATYSLTMNEERDGREVYCIVYDGYDQYVQTDTVTLDTRFKPVIITQPVSTWAYDGENVAVGIEATGDGLTYTWYYKNASSSSFKESSLTTPIYAVKAAENTDGRQLYCIVTDAYGNTAKSDTVTLDTRYVVDITQQPQSVTASAGETVTFTVKATGDGLTYQWQYRNAGVEDWTDSTNTKASYATELKESRNGREVRCIVKDAYGNIEISEAATMRLTMVQITKQPVDAWAYEDEKATVSVAATGDDLRYEWYYRNAGDSEFTKSTTTSATYSLTMSEARDGREVYCIVYDGYDQYVQSDTVTLVTKYKPTITEQPTSVTASAEQNVTFTIKAQGEEPLSYQWYYRNAGTTTWKEAASTAATYTTTMKAERDGRDVYCKVTDANGATVSSKTVTMNLPPVKITDNPNDVTASAEESVTFSVAAMGDGPLTYQWYYRNAGTTTWKEGASTEASYTTTMKAERDGREVYCLVTDGYGQTAKSGTATMNLPEVRITKNPSDATAPAEQDVTFRVEAEGDGPLTYQWYYRNAGTTTWKEASSTEATYTTTVKEERDGREVYCKVTDAYGQTAKSATAKMILEVVKTPLEITSHPKDATVAAGNTAKFTVAAQGDGLKYQWEYKKPGSDTWTESSTGTTATYSFTMKDTYDGRQIRCVITDKYDDTVTSNAADLTLAPPPIKITNQPDDAVVSAGDTASFTVAAEGDSLTYQWQYKKSGSSTWSTASSTSTTYSFTMKDTYDDRSIRCVITDGDGNTVTSNTASLNLPVVTITSQPKSASVAVGDKATFTIKATGDGLEYQWQYKKSGSSTWSTASSTSTTYSFTMKESYDDRSIRCKVKDAYGNTVTSSSAKLTLE